VNTRPPGRRDKRRPRDNRPKGGGPKKPPAPKKLSVAALEHARRVAADAPPFSADVRARLAVVLAPMAAHLAAQPAPARVRAA
jgi:hypothetical protein